MPNVGPYIYDVSISGFTRCSIYIYEISSLRVNYLDLVGECYMGSMQWQLGREMGTIPAFASRTQENQEGPRKTKLINFHFNQFSSEDERRMLPKRSVACV